MLLKLALITIPLLTFTVSGKAFALNPEKFHCKAMTQRGTELTEAILQNGFTGFNATIDDYFFSMSESKKNQYTLSIMQLSNSNLLFSLEFHKPAVEKGFLVKLPLNKELLLMFGCKHIQ